MNHPAVFGYSIFLRYHHRLLIVVRCLIICFQTGSDNDDDEDGPDYSAFGPPMPLIKSFIAACAFDDPPTTTTSLAAQEKQSSSSPPPIMNDGTDTTSNHNDPNSIIATDAPNQKKRLHKRMMLPLGVATNKDPTDGQSSGVIFVQSYYRYRCPYAICHGKSGVSHVLCHFIT